MPRACLAILGSLLLLTGCGSWKKPLAPDHQVAAVQLPWWAMAFPNATIVRNDLLFMDGRISGSVTYTAPATVQDVSTYYRGRAVEEGFKPRAAVGVEAYANPVTKNYFSVTIGGGPPLGERAAGNLFGERVEVILIVRGAPN